MTFKEHPTSLSSLVSSSNPSCPTSSLFCSIPVPPSAPFKSQHTFKMGEPAPSPVKEYYPNYAWVGAPAEFNATNTATGGDSGEFIFLLSPLPTFCGHVHRLQEQLQQAPADREPPPNPKSTQASPRAFLPNRVAPFIILKL